MRPVTKEICREYEVRNDGKNSIYVSFDGEPYCFSEFYKGGSMKKTMIRIYSGGLQLVNISDKLKRRFNEFLKKGHSIYATANYIYHKTPKPNHVTS